MFHHHPNQCATCSVGVAHSNMPYNGVQAHVHNNASMCTSVLWVYDLSQHKCNGHVLCVSFATWYTWNDVLLFIL